MKRRPRRPGPATEPSLEYAALHRLFAWMAGAATDRFAGCSFPACPCDCRCVIFDAGGDV